MRGGGGGGLSWVAWIFFLWISGARIFFFCGLSIFVFRPQEDARIFFIWFSLTGFFFFLLPLAHPQINSMIVRKRGKEKEKANFNSCLCSCPVQVHVVWYLIHWIPRPAVFRTQWNRNTVSAKQAIIDKAFLCIYLAGFFRNVSAKSHSQLKRLILNRRNFGLPAPKFSDARHF